ncbi:MAG: restriction endonuclease [Caldiserica bacterium]|jgi:restriction system protein|nr:restriction endonuclease [Caldisericota bacterium]MDH7562528.1 restriction endonuclease [Caldisericota bacterium]
MSLWLVRLGKHGEWESLSLEKGLAVIGWKELPDLSPVKTKEELYELLKKYYPENGAKTLQAWLSILWYFSKEMKPGDLIASPLKSRSAIALGEVVGDYKYQPDLPEKHVRPVKWDKELPRDAFESDLLFSFGALGTVCRIQRNNAEERVRALLAVESVPKPSTEKQPPGEREEWAPIDQEQYALDQIRGYISRKFKGHDLARLVGAVLESQGYKVQISPEGPDGGVDIIAGHGPMGFDDPRIVVQVKSGDSPVDVKILRELQGVMKNYGAKYGLMVSWGGYRGSVPKEASRLYFELRLWDADDLVRAVLENYQNLPDDIQADLPLKRIWVLVNTEEE